jgi:hypothetical protein
MNRVILMIGICLACLGCHSRQETYWFHPDRTLEEITEDCRQCNRQAQARAQEEHVLRYRDSVEQGQSWRMGNELVEEVDRELDEANSFAGCMSSRGYRQVQAFPLGSEIRKKDCFGGDSVQHLAGR